MSRADRVYRFRSSAGVARYLWLMLAVLGYSQIAVAAERTLYLQVKVSASFSGIPREQIRPAETPSDPARQPASLKDFNYSSCLTDALKQALQTTAAFQEVVAIKPEAKAEPSDGSLLLVEVSKWGFRYSPADKNKGTNRKGQLEHLVRFTILRPEGRTSRRELFLSGKERLLQEYRDDEALLIAELQKSIQVYAGLLANKVVYEK